MDKDVYGHETFDEQQEIFMINGKPCSMSVIPVIGKDIRETIIYLQKIVDVADKYNMVTELSSDYGDLSVFFMDKK